MRPDHRLQRIFCDAPLAGGQAVAATVQQRHYLLNVLRMSDGSQVLVFNGRDGEWHAVLRLEGRKHLLLVPEIRTMPQTPASDLSFCFAPLKTGRLDYLVQKATEMGAGTLRPVLTQHTQMTRLNLERLRANIIEAAEQCGILSIPSICPPVSLAELIEQWENDRSLIFCDEQAVLQDPLPVLRALQGRPLGVLVGPEGGFSDEERRQLAGLPFTTAISLGPRILRADTAAVAALAIVQACAGDWQPAFTQPHGNFT